MRKRMVWVILLLGNVLSAVAQSQDIQQLVLDLEKLAQMRSMLAGMYNGYATLTNGYNRISGLAKGNFDLHKNYLDGLLHVSAEVSGYKKIGAVYDLQEAIASESRQGYMKLLRSRMLATKEMADMKTLLDEVNKRCGRKMSELQLVVSDGGLRMSDGERIAAIDRIDYDVGEMLGSLRAKLKEQQELMEWRTRRSRGANQLKILNGIK